jgi:hypothetical protein
MDWHRFVTTTVAAAMGSILHSARSALMTSQPARLDDLGSDF